MGWKILLPQEIMDEGEQLLVDAGHTPVSYTHLDVYKRQA